MTSVDSLPSLGRLERSGEESKIINAVSLLKFQQHPYSSEIASVVVLATLARTTTFTD